MSRAIESRIIHLEQCAVLNSPGGLGCVVHCREGEPFEVAAKRQGFTGGGLLCIGEVMAPDDWCRAAKAQQMALMEEVM
jgi:hypothetical protein